MGVTLQQNNTSENLLFYMTLSADGKTPATGKSPTVTISKNGAAFASPSGAISEVGNGWYMVAANSDDADTTGTLIVHAEAADCDNAEEVFDVVAAYEAGVAFATLDGVTVLTTVPRVMRRLPKNLPDEVTSATICDSIIEAHSTYSVLIGPQVPSANVPMDGFVETLLAAVAVRDSIPGLSDREGSRTAVLYKMAMDLCDKRKDATDAPSIAMDVTPVGPGGREAEGDTQLPIFKVPRPDTDEYEDLNADTPHRPGLQSD